MYHAGPAVGLRGLMLAAELADNARKAAKKLAHSMKYENKLTAVVVLGKMNPSILSHDFLKQNKILPAELLDKAPKPMITPVLSVLEYDRKLAIVVEQERFVAQSEAAEATSFLPSLVTEYFTKLPFTPLSGVGVNFQGKGVFADVGELQRLSARLAPGGAKPLPLPARRTPTGESGFSIKKAYSQSLFRSIGLN